MDTLRGCARMFPVKQGGIQVLAGLTLFIQTVGSLLRKPWPEKPARQIWQKNKFGEFTLMEKYFQLILVKCIW
jgi:hypothetical protein